MNRLNCYLLKGTGVSAAHRTVDDPSDCAKVFLGLSSAADMPVVCSEVTRGQFAPQMPCF